MTVSTTDGRVKQVYGELIDKVSTEFPLSGLFTDVGPALSEGESIDICTRATAISFEDASADADLTVQTQAPTANTLTVNQAAGAIVSLPAANRLFDLGGSWPGQLANQILIELNDSIDINVYTAAIASADDSGATTYWVNPAGATLTDAHTRTALAKMLKLKGVRRTDLVWCLDPYGEGSLASVSAYTTNAAQNSLGDLGMPTIGALHGIPVVTSASVPSSFTVACTAVSVSSNVATVTVAAGHGIVVGHKVTIAGITTPLTTAASVATAGATSFTVPLTAADGAMADGTGTVTVVVTCNGLLNRRRAFCAKPLLPNLTIVEKEKRIGQNLKASAWYGRKLLAGAWIGLGSPSASI